jgi:hypothetical protein
MRVVPSDVMEEFHKEMRALGVKVLDMFYKALGLSADQIRDTLTATMHLNMFVPQYLGLINNLYFRDAQVIMSLTLCYL